MGVESEMIQEMVALKAVEHGLHLLELNLKRTSAGVSIKIFVDSETGVTIDQCSRLSRDVDAAIEGQQMLKNAYTLEVSSPGVDRPLTEAWQFRKNIGRQLRIDFQNASKEVVQLKGRLMAVEAEWLVVVPSGKKKGATEVRIPMDRIQRAIVELDW